MDGLSQENVTCWEGRPKRQRKAPQTYWQEYVETDTWYSEALLEDVPDEEIHAACYDNNLEDDEDSEELEDLAEITDGLSFISEDEASEMDKEYALSSNIESSDERTESECATDADETSS